eukprot:CAMPEP_0172460400 /NCGR_PEP_ID=MMETSP1065-20121228/36779_1 /TAXON_ID=265537 /ORGANISM="Amphiprora paludosa, Strain CCMP125" /LENGTH=56 /DNA_ID=CAMNT_0013215417 /DNA_START=21 /DNA_END=187 /DNA_ORIENTATION=+
MTSKPQSPTPKAATYQSWGTLETSGTFSTVQDESFTEETSPSPSHEGSPLVSPKLR